MVERNAAQLTDVIMKRLKHKRYNIILGENQAESNYNIQQEQFSRGIALCVEEMLSMGYKRGW